MLDELVRIHNQRKRNKAMSKNTELFVVVDEEGSIYGIYDEYVDAEERMNTIAPDTDNDMFIEPYTLNKDFDPIETD